MSNIGTILIIDDNPTNLEVLYATLASTGYEIILEMNGEDGIKQAAQQQPDLILLDIMMPGIDGFETCCKLQSNLTTLSIPIIFMTALSDTEHKIKGLSLGAVDYITKPFQQEEVLARVNVHLKLKRATDELEQQVQERTNSLVQTLHSLKQMQLQLVQNEKMSALGQLVAGIAHEINNPMGCINGNFALMEANFKELFQIIDSYEKEVSQPSIGLQQKIEAIDLNYLRSDFPKMFESTHTAIDRIKDISDSLRIFSRADTTHPILFNIHEGIDSTILILKHRLKASDTYPEIEVIKEYADLPLIKCYPGQLNQVFMNIIANAIDALEEASLNQSNHNQHQIRLKTALAENEQSILIYIQDNGIGINDKIKNQIFEHLFTTKEVGKGTGLGLAIAHQIIIEKHHGSIEVNSETGKGTEFLITLPIHQ
ncbi:response regulator receiver sensor signal transduction histidine kinase [Calothrix sp. NIES-4071]|nr:response regulator receiver sensor signal transduction histidine kinase [Calothrix sp. NIES-4071]BAZ63534.1 response regulator receiver sensor signal transduction histidine kinase [Calothrix sp. NIES-4105]